MRVVEAHPAELSSAWIAAKVGTERARQLIESGEVAPRLDGVERDLVLGKLGVEEAEARSLARYREAMDPKGDLLNTREWTRRMGHMGTAKALLYLAQDLRHPGTYVRGHGSKRMVRADVLRGLVLAFPRETLLQTELTSNASFEPIEAWAEKRLDVRWTTERPPYVHEAPSSRF